MKTRVYFGLMFLCLSCALTISSAAPAGDYSFTTVDFPAAGIIGQGVTAISNGGRIAGGWQVGPGLRGYLFEGGRFTTVDVNHQGGAIRGINNSNQLSGFFTDSSGTHAFLFDLDRGARTDIDVPGANLTEGIGLNDGGEIVGDYREAATGVFHGF